MIDLQKLKESSLIYLIGSVGYTVIEILWRGFTHWTMAITGGICFSLVYKMNLRCAGKKLWNKCFRGATIITSVEYVVGCIVNLKLKWDVWDYSNLFLNIKGQVCLLYTALWFFLSIPMIFLSTLLHKKICGRSSHKLSSSFKRLLKKPTF